MKKLKFKDVTLELLRRERRRSPNAVRQVAAGDMAEIQRAHCQILAEEIDAAGLSGVLEVLDSIRSYGSAR